MDLRYLPALLLSGILILAAGCGRDEKTDQENRGDTVSVRSVTVKDVLAASPIMELIETEPRLSILTTAIDSAGLRAQLTNNGPITLFAPADQAFNAIPQDSLTALLRPVNRQHLRRLVLSHISTTRIPVRGAPADSSITTLAGSAYRLTYESGRLHVNGQPVVAEGTQARNGVIYVIGNLIQAPVALPATER